MRGSQRLVGRRKEGYRLAERYDVMTLCAQFGGTPVQRIEGRKIDILNARSSQASHTSVFMLLALVAGLVLAAAGMP